MGERMEIDFDEERHEYSKDGVPVPSVTTVLAKVLDIYKGVPPFVLERAAIKGTAIHDLTEFYDDDDLDFTTVPEEYSGYLSEYIAVKEELGMEVLESERRVFSEEHWYAGTLDRIVTLKRPISVDGTVVIPPDEPVLLEIKSTYSLMPTTGPQTAAYALALSEMDGKEYPYRMCIWLRPDKHKVIPLLDRNDPIIWSSTLILYNWYKRHKLLK